MPGIDAADDAVGPYVNAGAPAALIVRSEERRVGKEC